jgi:hypothetical protein
MRICIRLLARASLKFSLRCEVTRDLVTSRRRISGMRGVLLAWLFACALAVSASGETPAPTHYTRFGLMVTLPSGWRAVRQKLTPCVDPSERLTVARGRSLVMLQERLHPALDEFRSRPSHFALPGRPHDIECCAPVARRGWSLRFADKGRGFYVYVYLGRAGMRAEALGILDSLRVEPRPAEVG